LNTLSRLNIGCILVSILCCFLCTAQDVKTTASSFTDFQAFNDYITKVTNDSIRTQATETFLRSAKLSQDPIKIADGYYFMSLLHSRSNTALIYTDSIISLTKSLTDTKYPGLGYLQKAIEYYHANEYYQALDNLIIAEKYAMRHTNEFQQICINHYIGLLKNSSGSKEDALKIFKSNMLFFDKKDHKTKYNHQYLKSLCMLGECYNNNLQIDSAIKIIKQGTSESQKFKNFNVYPSFLLSYGFSKAMSNDNDQSSIDSLKKALTYFNKKNKKELATSHILIAHTYDKLKEHYKAIKHLKKVDSIYNISPKLLTKEMRGALELLKNQYDITGNKEGKLEALDKLILVDSVMYVKHKNLSRKIVEEYDTPKLLLEKEEFIDTMKKDKSYSKKTTLLLTGLVSILLLVSIYFIWRNNTNKKRFNRLLETHNSNSKKIDSREKKTVLTNISELDLPEDFINSILNQLEKFESSKKFIEKPYTLNTLSKELNTNSAYLSKIINAAKGVNFSNYLNSLRVDYAIDKLTTDKLLRSYTIKAISEEVGFNNVQSFSNAFHKKTGIFPSYFIKKLNAIKVESN